MKKINTKNKYARRTSDIYALPADFRLDAEAQDYSKGGRNNISAYRTAKVVVNDYLAHLPIQPDGTIHADLKLVGEYGATVSTANGSEYIGTMKTAIAKNGTPVVILTERQKLHQRISQLQEELDYALEENEILRDRNKAEKASKALHIINRA